jgi:hypothetical protein
MGDNKPFEEFGVRRDDEEERGPTANIPRSTKKK